MKDRAPEQEYVSWLTIWFGIIIGIIILVLGLYGNNKKAQSIARCTESTIATVSYENVEPYLYAPYKGGEVKTRYRTYVKYSFTVDEYTYSIDCAFEGKVSVYPDTVDIIYNPDNPNEFWYNHAVINNVNSNKIEWYPNVWR